VEAVEATPAPVMRTMFDDVFEETPEFLEKQYRELVEVTGEE